MGNPFFLQLIEQGAPDYPNFVGATQFWTGTISGTVAGVSAGDTINWSWFVNGVFAGTQTTTATNNGSSIIFSTTLSYGSQVVWMQATDATSDVTQGVTRAVFIIHSYNATVSATLGATQTVTGYAFQFNGAQLLNQIGNVTPSLTFNTLHNAATIAAFNVQTNRSISVAGQFQFQTPATIGSSISIGDLVEFGYRGNEAFYGWVYSIDKSNAYVYTVTAYDGGYGVAQAVSGVGSISRAAATLTVSGLLGAFGLQAAGLGNAGTQRTGVNVSSLTVPEVFGWGFAQGQVLQKIEAVALGFGYVAYTDYVSNLMVSNYQFSIFNGSTIEVPVGTVQLKENVDSFIMQSKMFDPSEQYGNWQVIGQLANGNTITEQAGNGKPSRTLGSGWLYIQQSDATQLSTIAATYNSIFKNGVWTVQMWTNRWFDPSGVNIGGSIGAYIGDDKYLFTTIPTVGMVITPMGTGTPIATITTTGMTNAVYVRNSESPQVCSVVGTQIDEIKNFMVGKATVSATIGNGGTLTGQSICFDGLDTLFTADSAGTVWATNWYRNTSSVVASLGLTVNTVASGTYGVCYTGTSSGVVNPATGATITGTGTYNVGWLTVDEVGGNVYAIAGGLSVPYFAIGGSSVLGTFAVPNLLGPGGALYGAVDSLLGVLLFAGTNAVVGVGGGATYIATIPAGFTITDLTWDSAYNEILVTAVGTVGTRIFKYGISPT